MIPRKNKTSLLFALACAIALFSLLLIMPQKSYCQSNLITKYDSVYHNSGTDSIKTVTVGGLYENGAFTVRSTAIGDTLKPQARYGTSSQWVTTSVKNIRTQASDTNIVVTASSWPVDYEINDPCIVGFRLVPIHSGYTPTRKTYVNFRFRRGK